MTVNLLWGSWSVVQAAVTTLDFDYLSYAKIRFEAYFYHKELFRGLIEQLQGHT